MFILMLLVTLLPFVTFAQTEFEGEVSGEWNTEGSPYVQVGEAEIPAEESLTILPGVEVILGEDMTLTCNGVITAQGTEEDTIRIHGTSVRDGGQLILWDIQETVSFEYCRFDSLERAIYSIGTPVNITHSLFYNCYGMLDLRCNWVEITGSSFIADTLIFGMMSIGQNTRPESVIFEGNYCRLQPTLNVFMLPIAKSLIIQLSR